MKRHPAVRIALYNHKGGVGKTTLTANIAAILAKSGKKTLLVDSDPQANLTSYLIEETVLDSLLDESGGSTGQTIWSAMLPIIKAEGTHKYIPPIETSTNNLFILPGDIKLAEFEEHMSTFWGECFRRLVRGYKGTTALSQYIDECATKGDFDFIFYDTGPNIGPLNRIILLDCDYFIVPVACDLYSKRAMKSLGQTIKTWITEWETISKLAPEGTYLLPGLPKFLGYIPQRFKVYRGELAGPSKKYIPQIEKVVFSDIISVIKKADSRLVPTTKTQWQLGEVQDLTTLVQKAQDQGLPLSDVEGGTFEHKEKARKSFEEIAKKIIQRTKRA